MSVNVTFSPACRRVLEDDGMKSIAVRCKELLAVLVLAAVVGCSGGDDMSAPGTVAGGSQMATIEGNVVYLERMLLPPGVEVEVQLQDVSRPDAMAAVLATVSMTPEGGPPYPFVIEYDPNNIDSRMTYALRATIVHGDRLMFTNTDYINAFSGNPVEVLVRRVPEAVHPAGPPLEGQVWQLHTLEGEPAAPGAGGKPVDILFDAEAMRASGFSGCNRYSGGYVREGDYAHGSPLSFTPLAGTMMACEEGGELERRYLQLLGTVSAFHLKGDTLSLLAGAETVATFKAG